MRRDRDPDYGGRHRGSTHRSPFGPGYLKGGYFTDKGGYVRQEVIVEWPQEVASVLSQKRMTSNALRRFFTMVRALDNRFRSGDSLETIKSKILKIKAFTNYAISREGSKVPAEFKEFIDRNIDLAVRDGKHFRAFVEHFECVLAYFRQTRF